MSQNQVNLNQAENAKKDSLNNSASTVSDNESSSSAEDPSDADFQVDELTDEETSDDQSDGREEEETYPSSSKKKKSTIKNMANQREKSSSPNVSEAETEKQDLSIEPDLSIASTVTLLNVPSPSNSVLRVPDISECVDNSIDASAIQILRLGTNKTKSYPCGLCGDGTWFTKPQRHFSRCHQNDALFKEIERLKQTIYNPVSTSTETDDANDRIKVLQTTLLNQAVKKHNDHVIKDRKGECTRNFNSNIA